MRLAKRRHYHPWRGQAVGHVGQPCPENHRRLCPFRLAHQQLGSLPPESLETRFGREDYLAALGVFLLVFLCLFPVAVPFLLIDDVRRALRFSNAIAVGMLFLTGFTFGGEVGSPWRTGFLMVLIGIAMVAIAMALGG